MNTDISSSCKCYGVYDGENQIAFMGILHFPHPRNAKIKRVSRLVVLPDYQGIGIGYRFLCAVAKMYKEKGYDFHIVTSAKNLVYKLSKSNEWTMMRIGVSTTKSLTRMVCFDKTMRNKCKTASFVYKG